MGCTPADKAQEDAQSLAMQVNCGVLGDAGGRMRKRTIDGPQNAIRVLVVATAMASYT